MKKHNIETLKNSITYWPMHVKHDLIMELEKLRAVAETLVRLGYSDTENFHGEDCPRGDPDLLDDDECECGSDEIREALQAAGYLK